MPVFTTSNKAGPYSCNGSQTIFPFTFPIFSESDLEVTLRDADGNETILTYGSHYTVSKSGVSWDSGGNVVTITNYPSGKTITIRLVLAVTQETDYVENDSFPAELHENDHNKITMIAQQIKERADRALVFPISDPASSIGEIASVIQRKGLYLMFDAVTGKPVCVTNIIPGTVTITDFAKTVLDDATVQDIRNTLNVCSKDESPGIPQTLTGDSTLAVITGYKKRYISTTKHNLLALPVSATAGDLIEILTNEFGCWITHADAEHLIIDKHLNTIKGNEGRLWLPLYDSIILRYIGTGYYYSLPGSKLTDPGILPTGAGQGTSFSPDGVYLAVAHTTTPFITIYKRSGDTFTKLTDPGILPNGIGIGTFFSPDGVYLAVGHATTPFITIYKNKLPATKAWQVVTRTGSRVDDALI